MNDSIEIIKKVDVGYSDEKLERLSRVQVRFEAGIVPWATWESENSSFGKTFRGWARFPKILPLYISSDHGVHWGATCWPNEIENKYRTFLTWNKKKSDLMREKHGRNSHHVPHPWVFYRSKYFPELPKNRSGTLVFYAHSNDTGRPIYENIDKYMNDLKSLSEKYHPIVMCLSFHDINKGLHKELRKYKIPLVTAGTTNSQLFVDRFYSLLYQFKFASSSDIGSHTSYIIEAGIPFFLYGPYPQYKFTGSNAVEDGTQDLRDYGDEDDIQELDNFEKMLSFPQDEVTEEQIAIVSKYLGLNSEMTRFRIALILWRELFLHLGELITVYSKQTLKGISKITAFILSKEKS